MEGSAVVPAVPINLAHEPSFRLGEVEVYPATRQLVRGERRDTLEPRVMQVLVALAHAKGAVLTRDELIERCWDGRIVSENAINRVISRIRQIAADFGMDSFQLETITKVGYRLITRDEVAGAEQPISTQAPESRRTGPDRRLVLAGAAAAVMATAAVWYGRDSAFEQTASAEARTLYDKGVEAQRQGTIEQDRQALAYFRQAVAADRNYAAAWGALAIAYRQLLQEAPHGKQEALAARSRSAAERALALDPQNEDGRVALILIRPIYRNWAAVERDCLGALAAMPKHWLLQHELIAVLGNVGRWQGALQRLLAEPNRDAFRPRVHSDLSSAYAGTGRLEEAEETLVEGLDRWPGHPELWFSRFYLLMYGGRPAEAIRFASDVEGRPYGVPEIAITSHIKMARTLETRRPAEVEALLTDRLEAVKQGSISPGVVAQLTAELGRDDLTFSLLDAYFFGRGALAGRPPPGPFARRFTAFLFFSPTTRLHADPRFIALTEAVGLEDYWRATRTLPDYRRTAQK